MTDGRHPATGCLDPETLAAFIDGRLEPRQRAAVEEHLADCAECYEVWMDAVEAGVPEVTVADRRLGGRRWLAIAAGVAATLVATSYGWGFWRDARVARAVTVLAETNRDTRFTAGRLSIDREWAPPAASLRSPIAEGSNYAARSAALGLVELTASDDSARGLHARALALLAQGDITGSIAALETALTKPPVALAAAIHADLAAALLERHRREANEEDARRALEEAESALRLAPRMLQALFNRAAALEALGRTEFRAAWETYIAVDNNQQSAWMAEAKRRMDRDY